MGKWSYKKFVQVDEDLISFMPHFAEQPYDDRIQGDSLTEAVYYTHHASHHHLNITTH